MDRRRFLGLSAAALCPTLGRAETLDVRVFDRGRVLKAADAYLKEAPATVTAFHSPRSIGGQHDYFSEGDYWWPDPKNPDGPYIQRDGMSNPDNFDDHRRALMRLSVQMPALSAAWMITKQRRYADHAARHSRAWFLDDATRMNPDLRYAQAIHGRFTGRGTGIIDTIHLVEVARAASALEPSGALSDADRAGIRRWFATYLDWLTTSKNGTDERDAKNNHGTCWVMQAAEFARYTGNAKITAFCRDRYKTVLVPLQIAPDGSFPEELRRTKPYGYSLFNLDAMATVCQILSTPSDNLFQDMSKAMEFMFPFIADKKKWTRPPDVMYFDGWPVRQPSLL
ncbi:MAG TPA: alginate lyase family protein, partial [Bryobacteraceae bacterium]|nr:alginate lyase family protein [Bryobacteraceae bacterium]